MHRERAAQTSIHFIASPGSLREGPAVRGHEEVVDADGCALLMPAELGRDSCITQLKAQGPSRTCNESKEDEGPSVRGHEEVVDADGCARITPRAREHSSSVQKAHVVRAAPEGLDDLAWPLVRPGSAHHPHAARPRPVAGCEQAPGFVEPARPDHLVITMIEWIRTSRLSIKNSGVGCRV